jgi:hypothetical protein
MYINIAILLHIEGCISYVANRIVERSNTTRGTQSLATGWKMLLSRTNGLKTGDFRWQPWFGLLFGGALVCGNSDLFGGFPFCAVLKYYSFFLHSGCLNYLTVVLNPAEVGYSIQSLGCRLVFWGIVAWFRSRARNIYLLRSAQTTSGAHPGPNQTDTWGCIPNRI